MIKHWNCRCGGIGRRVGFKIRFMQVSGGSIPSTGTHRFNMRNQAFLRGFSLLVNYIKVNQYDSKYMFFWYLVALLNSYSILILVFNLFKTSCSLSRLSPLYYYCLASVSVVKIEPINYLRSIIFLACRNSPASIL